MKRNTRGRSGYAVYNRAPIPELCAELIAVVPLKEAPFVASLHQLEEKRERELIIRLIPSSSPNGFLLRWNFLLFSAWHSPIVRSEYRVSICALLHASRTHAHMRIRESGCMGTRYCQTGGWINQSEHESARRRSGRCMTCRVMRRNNGTLWNFQFLAQKPRTLKR